MSRNRKDELAPSLFPFLAVLLCTMGALVLILMLVVGQAQATANEAITAKQQQQEDVTAQLDAMKDSLTKEREKQHLELEKKRLTLQAFEEQIRESIQQLTDLERTLDLIENQASVSELQEDETQKQVAELQQQLAKAAEKLKTKVDNPTGNKPVFAIIPYEGTSGTHRRPIYLECTSKGVIVQPEGMLVSLVDLRPPYGPGNPLDAILRTVRSRYVPENGALTSTAYPLLIVRPSGVQTYAMARLAMAGWDDQFGYELVEERLDLVYPDGEPGLRDEMEKSLALARARQAALVMAMPGKYRNYVDAFESEEYQPLSGGSFGASMNASRNGLLASSSDTDGSTFGSDATSTGENGTNARVGGLANTRGGFNLAAGEVVGSGLADSISEGDSLRSETGGYGRSATSSGDSFLGQGSDASFINSSNGDATTAVAGDQPVGNGGVATGMNSSVTNGGIGSESSTTSLQATSSSRLNPSSGGTSGSQKTKTSTASTPSSSEATLNANTSAGSGGGQVARNGAVGIAAPSMAVGNAAREVTTDAQGVTGVNLKFDATAAEPVAKRKGRNWAWSERTNSGTAVVRAIKLLCYEDRWIIWSDAKSGTTTEIIMLDEPPQVCAERMANNVADRVDRWGLALMGGYWKPVLEVEVAAGAEPQFQQLLRLLEGSGLDVKRTK